MRRTNVVAAVMDVVLAVAESTPTTTVDTTPVVAPVTSFDVVEGEGKSEVVVTRVAAHARRGAFAPQRVGESFAQYQERLRLGRMAEAERKRLRRVALKAKVFDKAFTSVQEHGTERDLAVAASIPVKQAHTRVAEDVVAGLTTRYRGFSKAQGRKFGYDSFLVSEHDGPYCVWPMYKGVTVQGPDAVRQHLDNHFARVSDKRSWKQARYSLKGTRMLQRAEDEHVYRSMTAAQRSKANPLLHIGVTPATVPYVPTFQPASPAPFTQTERLDHSRVAPVAGASDKMVSKHAPSVILGKDGKVTHTYGGSVPAIPSDMHGLWCDRDRSGVYGSGQSDLAFQPFLRNRRGTVIPDQFTVPNRQMDAEYRRYQERSVMGEYAPDMPLYRVKPSGIRRPSIAPAHTVTANQFTVCSYPRVESAYHR